MGKKIVKWIITGLTAFFFISALAIMFIGIKAAHSNKPMSIFGYIFSVVPTESMQPEINPGDFVFSKKVDFDTLKEQDIIVYYSNEKDIYIVHRIIGTNPDGSFIMMGDNNNGVVDKEFVTEENYVSKVVKVFSFLNLGGLVINHRGVIFGLLFFIFLGLVVVEGCKIALTIKEEKLKEQEQKKEEEKQKFIESEKERIREEILKELQDDEKAK